MSRLHGVALGTLGVAVLTVSLSLGMPGLGHGSPPPGDGKEVLVVNGPDRCVPVKDCDAPGRHPWHDEWFFLLGDDVPNQNQALVVPAGKRLVVEHVSVSLSADIGILPDVVIHSSNPSQPALSLRQHVLLTKTGEPFGRSRFVANQPMRSYIDAGSVTVTRWPNTGTVNGNITLVGYLIDP